MYSVPHSSSCQIFYLTALWETTCCYSVLLQIIPPNLFYNQFNTKKSVAESEGTSRRIDAGGGAARLVEASFERPSTNRMRRRWGRLHVKWSQRNYNEFKRWRLLTDCLSEGERMDHLTRLVMLKLRMKWIWQRGKGSDKDKAAAEMFWM